jgi:hypothetical protein
MNNAAVAKFITEVGLNQSDTNHAVRPLISFVVESRLKQA